MNTTARYFRIAKTYRGKGAGRRTVWAVQECYMIGEFEAREGRGDWATEAEAIAHMDRLAS